MGLDVVLDAGHGAHDSGAVGCGLQEKERALTLTKMVDEELRANGVSTFLTRSTDVFVTLSGRAQMANERGARIFVSFHLNSGGGTGYESFTYTSIDDATRRLQGLLHDAAMSVLSPLGFRDRGRKQSNLAVCRETHMPAVLTENGFIDNSSDMLYIRQDDVLRKLARAYAKAICTYLGRGYSEGSTGGGGGSIGVAYIEGSNINLRSAPTTNSTVLRKLNSPESYLVWREQSGWLCLGGSNGNEMWVYGDPSYIRFVRN